MSGISSAFQRGKSFLGEKLGQLRGTVPWQAADMPPAPRFTGGPLRLEEGAPPPPSLFQRGLDWIKKKTRPRMDDPDLWMTPAPPGAPIEGYL